jgi:hypothetical protein
MWEVVLDFAPPPASQILFLLRSTVKKDAKRGPLKTRTPGPPTRGSRCTSIARTAYVVMEEEPYLWAWAVPNPHPKCL